MRVLTITESIWLNLDRRSVAGLVLDLEGWAAWHPDAEESFWIGRAGWQAGNRLRIVPRRSARPGSIVVGGGRVTEAEPGESGDAAGRLGWSARLLGARVEHTLSIRAEGCGTRVDLRTTARAFAVRVLGHESVIRVISRGQRRFLRALRARGEQLLPGDGVLKSGVLESGVLKSGVFPSGAPEGGAAGDFGLGIEVAGERPLGSPTSGAP